VFFFFHFARKIKWSFKTKKKDPSSKKGEDNIKGIGANSVSGGSTVFRVTVPDSVQPGEEFQV
jgi:hypothetical protein